MGAQRRRRSDDVTNEGYASFHESLSSDWEGHLAVELLSAESQWGVPCIALRAQAWTTLTADQVVGTVMRDTSTVRNVMMASRNVHWNEKASVFFAKMACAMGNFHCDHAYCNTWFCNKSPWKEKYAPPAGKKMGFMKTMSRAAVGPT